MPTATWVVQGPGSVIVPILLYHHIDESPSNSQYYVSTGKFEAQMRLLRDWEYTTITIEMLVKAINDGTALPPRPILITFDDGDLDNYTNAFSIMRRYGFKGVMYIVGGYMGAPEYMSAEQIKDMARAGWEVGSHAMTHPDLTKIDPQLLNFEICDSRTYLEKELNVPILSFAYPFGTSTHNISDKVYLAGYLAGMNLGSRPDQYEFNLFNLQRLIVRGRDDLNKFASILPWQGDPIFLPTATPTPIGTQIPSQ